MKVIAIRQHIAYNSITKVLYHSGGYFFLTEDLRFCPVVRLLLRRLLSWSFVVSEMILWFQNSLEMKLLFICYDDFKQTIHQKSVSHNVTKYHWIQKWWDRFYFRLNKRYKNVWIINVPSIISRLDSVSDDFSWSYISKILIYISRFWSKLISHFPLKP